LFDNELPDPEPSMTNDLVTVVLYILNESTSNVAPTNTLHAT